MADVQVDMDDNSLKNKPPDTAWRQQRLPAWEPIMTPLKVILLFFVIGVTFVPTGTYLISSQNNIYEQINIYDFGDGSGACAITKPNIGKICNVTFTLTDDVTGPLYLYYGLNNYYQNHRRYVASRSPFQLMGQQQSESELTGYCDSMKTNGTRIYNPCGLIANSYFNDVIKLTSTTTGARLDESGIAWSSDVNDKFKQPDGFSYSVYDKASPCPYPTCSYYTDNSVKPPVTYQYYYPNAATTQYLYQTYPQISPIVGVTDEHFIVWMKTAALPNFRKLYGKLSGNFKKGDIFVFTVINNFQVDNFDGQKSLVITPDGEFGAKNKYLGTVYLVTGSICLILGILFSLKQLVWKRPPADPTLLKWD